MIEEWRDIPGFPLHQASNLGRIKSPSRWVIRRHTKPFYKRERILRPQPSRRAGDDRILAMGLRISRTGNGTNETVYVHHLVLLAFVGPRPEGMECCHYDGDPTNNRLENLRWDTPKNNCADKTRHGRASKPMFGICGGEAPRAKLTDAQILEIMASPWGKRGIGNRLADRFGVGNSAIYEVRRRYQNKPHLLEIIERRSM